MNKKIVAVLLLTIGLLLTFHALYLIYLRNTKLPVKTDVNLRSERVVPVLVQIPSLAINVNVTETDLTNNKWPLSNDSALHWKESPLPGQKGNSVIYGHNWANLFGNLRQVHPNAEVVIVYSDGSKKQFKIVDTYTVTADETHILNNSTDTRLTLYTCTGFLDSKRFVAIAIPS